MVRWGCDHEEGIGLAGGRLGVAEIDGGNPERFDTLARFLASDDGVYLPARGLLPPAKPLSGVTEAEDQKRAFMSLHRAGMSPRAGEIYHGGLSDFRGVICTPFTP